MIEGVAYRLMPVSLCQLLESLKTVPIFDAVDCLRNMKQTDSRPILIIKTGSTYPEIAEKFGDFDEWFAPFLADSGLEYRRIEVHKGAELPAFQEVGAALITGSPAMVTDREPWSEYTANWLRGFVTGGGLALGVCYGHQLLAHALGGSVADHPLGREIGTLPIRLTEAADADPLLGSLPMEFNAHLSHRQSVISAPPGAVLLASSEHEPHQAFRFADRCWGIQFHPEFNGPIMQAYLNRHAENIVANETDMEALYARAALGACDAPRVLTRFAELAREHVILRAGCR